MHYELESMDLRMNLEQMDHESNMKLEKIDHECTMNKTMNFKSMVHETWMSRMKTWIKKLWNHDQQMIDFKYQWL